MVDVDEPKPHKPPVVRGARACTVCRAAKMKCVGADDGQKQCQRCKRAGVECVFEKHRRGRKPGSKLSEASKMLRRLEKGLSNAKLKSQSTDAISSSPPYPGPDPRAGPADPQYAGIVRTDQYTSPDNRFSSNALPPLNIPPYHSTDPYSASNQDHRMDVTDDDDDDPDQNEESMFPAKLIRKENQRHSFFRTILNPEQDPPPSTVHSSRAPNSFPSPPPRTPGATGAIADPVAAGIVGETDVKMLFDLMFLRLNPFINLFDPALHSVDYVRKKCPFLFTTLIMAGCKFFKQDLYKPCRKLANDFAVRAFAEGWKRVEVVQAFACLTYWKEPEDNKTWTYIGYACRMAVELGLNRYIAHAPPHETEFQMRERRNRERTYLVLFVHDRSLTMQNGRLWMLPEDEIVRHSPTWHENGSKAIRPEDVIVAAFVQLRRIATSTTDLIPSPESAHHSHNDVNYDVVLRNCNSQLSGWMETWSHEMQRAHGENFHFSMLSLFRLYVRLFLNSYACLPFLSPSSRTSPSLQAWSTCTTSGLETLNIVSTDFASMSMLRYGQDSITTMTAYAAIVLLKLARSSNSVPQLNESTFPDVHSLISKTADAYHDASVLSPASSSAAAHARFLRSLVDRDLFESRQNEKDRFESLPIDPRLQPVSSSRAPSRHIMQQPSHSQPGHQMYPPNIQRERSQAFTYPPPAQVPSHVPPPQEGGPFSSNSPIRTNGADPAGPMAHLPHPSQYTPSPSSASAPPPSTIPQHASEQDAHYWRSMFVELGFGEHEHGVAIHPNAIPSNDDGRSAQYPDPQSHPGHHNTQQQPHPNHQPHPSHLGHQAYPPPPMHQAHSTHQNHPLHHSQAPYHHMHTAPQAGYAR